MGISLRAQSGAYSQYSPYSVFGIGDLYTQGTAYDRSKGGVGIAARSNRFINYLNPAAVTARDTLSFMMDFGLSSENKVYKQGNITSANNIFNLNNIVFSFPIYRKTAFSAGITPMSSVGYNFAHSVTDPSIIGYTGNIVYSSSGNGSIYQMFAGLGTVLFDHFSVGAQLLYYFGNIDKGTVMTFANESYRSLSSGYILQLNSMGVKLGAQWEKRLSPETSLVIGATYRPKSKIKGYSADYQFATLSSVRDTVKYEVDTLSRSSVYMGDEIGVGISIRKGDKWNMEFDYTRSDWTDTGMGSARGFSNIGNAVFSTGVSNTFRVGFELIPNRNDIRYYLRRCSYRMGAYYKNSYFKLDGNDINSMGVTLGMTLPVFRWYNGVSLGVDLGQRGNTTGNLTRERYALFSIGFNIHDIWFQKPRYE